MNLRNLAKTVFAGAVLSAALCFGTVAMPASVAKMATVEATTPETPFSGVKNGVVYYEGNVYKTGLLKKAADTKFYVVKEGRIGDVYTGVYTGAYVDELTKSTGRFSNTFIKKGSLASGVVSLKLYLGGQFASTFTGWQVVDGKRYYFTNGVAAANQFKLVPAYTNNGKKYKYYFRADGQVSENMFIDYGYSKTINWLKKAKGVKKTHMLSVDLVSHNMTIYLYDKQTKAFDIPAKVTVCSTSRKKNGTPVGHWRLEKTSAKRWVTVKDSKPVRRYQWAVHIIGTPTLFHSSAYATLGNAKTLYAFYYNGLGTSQTSYCIRQQACNAKIVYDLAKLTYKKQRVMVDIGRMKKAGPFAKITLANTTGKIASKRKTDPTDPVLFPNNKWWK
ncbi:MAG: hypothetical protein Q4E53_01580 [Eubacteriales bacterium]|nr:hypothetical protein [Eubacteriales bacterium]